MLNFDRVNFVWKAANGGWITPVSYTHLDVYKRQVALVLGGDGTILRAAELLRGSACPILGVNLGHVGFLAEAESHDLSFTLDRVLAGQYSVEERMTLEVCAYLPHPCLLYTSRCV